MQTSLSVAVVGGGWAGLAAAVQAVQDGHQVSLFEMAPQLGGRARSVRCQGEYGPSLVLDNGQHILIGAYTRSLALMSSLGVHPDRALRRMPLRLCYPDLEGLRLPSGAPTLAFARAVLTCRQWRWSERIRLLSHCTAWALRSFSCAPDLSVADLCSRLPVRVRKQLIEPLCVAALNTPADQASAQVFLNVLRAALFSGHGSSDLLLPCQPLSELLAEPAATWLQAQGAEMRIGHRVMRIQACDKHWSVDDRMFDAVVLACTSAEAARLVEPINGGWARMAGQLGYEPIVTVYLQSPGSRLPEPMMALHEGPHAPAQFAFDLGQLHQQAHSAGRFAFVISGAGAWLEQGMERTEQATLAQAQQALGRYWRTPPTVLRTLSEKRATFACTPGLQRPPTRIAARLLAAGDYVDGPFPATLEGAVKSGQDAARGLTS